MTGEDSPHPQIRLAGKKKVHFDIDAEKDTFFQTRDLIGRNPIMSPIYKVPTTFDSSLEATPSGQHGTLHKFFESCLSLERDPNALTEIENMLEQPVKERKDSAVNSLHKKKAGKEMRMNIQIGDYEVDSEILVLGSDVNILTK